MAMGPFVAADADDCISLQPVDEREAGAGRQDQLRHLRVVVGMRQYKFFELFWFYHRLDSVEIAERLFYFCEEFFFRIFLKDIDEGTAALTDAPGSAFRHLTFRVGFDQPKLLEYDVGLD